MSRRLRVTATRQALRASAASARGAPTLRPRASDPGNISQRMLLRPLTLALLPAVARATTTGTSLCPPAEFGPALDELARHLRPGTVDRAGGPQPRRKCGAATSVRGSTARRSNDARRSSAPRSQRAAVERATVERAAVERATVERATIERVSCGPRFERVVRTSGTPAVGSGAAARERPPPLQRRPQARRPSRATT